MAERAFAAKIEKMGFTDVWIGEHIPYGVEQAALYPLFTPDLIDLMKRVFPPERLATVAMSVIATARKRASE